VHVADECQNIPLALLHEPRIVMRPVVKDSVEYLERRDSLERIGLLNSLLVRPSPRQPGMYEIVDGMWRYHAAQDAGLTELACIVKTGLSDTDALALQLQANAVRAETTPIEYARQLRRILQQNPEMTAADLSRTAGKHPTWVKDRLGLLDLTKDVQLMVDRGEIPVTNAYMLAKIPRLWRSNYVDHARAMQTKAFSAMAAGVIKRFWECVNQGKLDERYLPEFKPQHFLRTVKEAKSELDDPQVGATILVAEKCRSLMDAWKACLKWMLHLDAESIEEQRQAAERKAQSRFKKEREAHHDPLDET
jgi:ParB/RepB/Spo0J family partition protein